MQKIRENNYDLLRICCTFAVVLVHVSCRFFLQFDKMGVPGNCTFPIMQLNLLTRFAVPCFVMLSGAFILNDERNADYKYFYRKAMKNIGITGIFFCLLYMMYSVIRLILSVFVLKRHTIDVFYPRLFAILTNLFIGMPSSHLWYLFMLVGLYIAAPFVIRLAIDMRRGDCPKT